MLDFFYHDIQYLLTTYFNNYMNFFYGIDIGNSPTYIIIIKDGDVTWIDYLRKNIFSNNNFSIILNYVKILL